MTITTPDGSLFNPETGLIYEPPRIHRFEVSEGAVVGEKIVVRWQVSNATHVELNGREVNRRSGKREFDAIETPIRLVARNQVATVEETRSVAVQAGSPVIFWFKSDAKTACGNRPIKFSWKVGGAAEVFLEEMRVEPTGSRKLLVYKSREFRLKARNEFGETERVIRVEARNVKPTIQEFVATPNACLVGDEVELSWQVKGAYQLQVNGIGDVTGTQKMRVKMLREGAHAFNLVALNYFGKTEQARVVINVAPQTFWHKAQRFFDEMIK